MRCFLDSVIHGLTPNRLEFAVLPHFFAHQENQDCPHVSLFLMYFLFHCLHPSNFTIPGDSLPGSYSLKHLYYSFQELPRTLIKSSKESIKPQFMTKAFCIYCLKTLALLYSEILNYYITIFLTLTKVLH